MQRREIFKTCPWQLEGQTDVFCYDCHEELLHNPVFLPTDIARFARLVKAHSLHEETKPQSRDRIAGRIRLLHEVIDRGLAALNEE